MAKYTIDNKELQAFLSFCKTKGCKVRQGTFNNPYQVAMIEPNNSVVNGSNEFYFVYSRIKTNRLTVDGRLADLLIEYEDMKETIKEFENPVVDSYNEYESFIKDN
jgi:hypothetical protein